MASSASKSKMEAFTVISFNPEEGIGYWVIMASNYFQRAMNDDLSPHGITYRQAEVLGSLALAGPMTQTELAERMRIEPPTLVGILDRMERDGWVRREPCPTDRRKKMIHATETAEPVWDKVLEVALEVRQRSIKGIPKETVDQLRETLRAMLANLGVDCHVPVSARNAVGGENGAVDGDQRLELPTRVASASASTQHDDLGQAGKLREHAAPTHSGSAPP